MANFFIVYAFIVAAIVFEKLVVNRSFGRAVLFVAVAIIAATIVGLRPLDAGYDTAVYVSYFNLIGHENLLFIKGRSKTRIPTKTSNIIPVKLCNNIVIAKKTNIKMRLPVSR